jgi:hypothetical protein
MSWMPVFISGFHRTAFDSLGGTHQRCLYKTTYMSIMCVCVCVCVRLFGGTHQRCPARQRTDCGERTEEDVVDARLHHQQVPPPPVAGRLAGRHRRHEALHVPRHVSVVQLGRRQWNRRRRRRWPRRRWRDWFGEVLVVNPSHSVIRGIVSLQHQFQHHSNHF